MIIVGHQPRSAEEWLGELDPDGTDEARREATQRALALLEGQTFATENDFVREVATHVAALEPDIREEITNRAMKPHEAGLSGNAEGVKAVHTHHDDEKQGEPESDPTFASLNEALTYLAGKTGFDIEQLEDYYSMDPAWSDYFTGIGPKDVDDELDQWKTDISNLEFQHDRQPVAGSGKKSKGDWATSTVRAAAKDRVSEAKDHSLFPGGNYTVHHKVSRHNLRALHAKMEKEPHAASNLIAVLTHNIGPAAGTPSPLKALLNMPGNLEVGPQDRIGDPGSDFDPNKKDGARTPRSELLNTVDSHIKREPVNFDEVARLLTDVQTLHNDALGKSKKSLLTPPLKAQWQKAKGGKFERR